MSNLAFLSLGSNINAEKNLPAAVALLSRYGTVKAVSTVWESAPVGYRDQPNFLNAAVVLETDLSAEEIVKRAIREVERSLKRVRTSNKNGPRTIDVDLALFNQDVLSLNRRKIPDPEIYKRPFLAVPLAELAPDYRHPETGQTLSEIARKFDLKTARMLRRNDVNLRRYFSKSN